MGVKYKAQDIQTISATYQHIYFLMCEKQILDQTIKHI